jgi:hypothetical protein
MQRGKKSPISSGDGSLQFQNSHDSVLVGKVMGIFVVFFLVTFALSYSKAKHDNEILKQQQMKRIEELKKQIEVQTEYLDEKEADLIKEAEDLESKEILIEEDESFVGIKTQELEKEEKELEEKEKKIKKEEKEEKEEEETLAEEFEELADEEEDLVSEKSELDEEQDEIEEELNELLPETAKVGKKKSH